MPFDHIADTQALILALKLEGHDELATRLQNVFDRASTGTELLFGTNFHAGEVGESSASLVTKGKKEESR